MSHAVMFVVQTVWPGSVVLKNILARHDRNTIATRSQQIIPRSLPSRTPPFFLPLLRGGGKEGKRKPFLSAGFEPVSHPPVRHAPNAQTDRRTEAHEQKPLRSCADCHPTSVTKRTTQPSASMRGWSGGGGEGAVVRTGRNRQMPRRRERRN